MKKMENPTTGHELTLRTIAMPADANPAGVIFGGWVMSQMDLAAFVRSSELARTRTVTVAVKEMTFKKPVNIGDTLCVFTRIERVGRTSIEVDVEAWTRRTAQATIEKVTEARFVMVAVDESGQKREITATV
jgi:acyl-CoA thioesterase YciA